MEQKKDEINSDNVIILGAGASYDAGIPLLKEFVQTMWEIALKGKVDGITLSKEESDIFKKAVSIQNELDTYHGRVNFNDRNIEDILSILSFNKFDQTTDSTENLNHIIKTLAKTIELKCKVKHDGQFKGIQSDGTSIYEKFWINLFKNYETKKNFPTIITFNYDLVLERSLFQIMNNIFFKTSIKGLNIHYYYDLLQEKFYGIKICNYSITDPLDKKQGIKLEESENKIEKGLDIEILKLHGSLNFPSEKKDETQFNIAQSLDNPFILPPIFNKMESGKGDKIWEVALKRLRNAKNVCFVGYSLPITDIYMQYFLKSAFGPNKELNKIFVFDPILYMNDDNSESLKSRYKNCFSAQLHERLIFDIGVFPGKNSKENVVYPDKGKFSHFVDILANDIDKIFWQ